MLRGDHELAILVADNGSGFPAGERQRFLEPYVTTRAKGTGLGLAIVHKIMEEHAGRVELDNSEPRWRAGQVGFSGGTDRRGPATTHRQPGILSGGWPALGARSGGASVETGEADEQGSSDRR
ncbi:MAG: ATP-binding protein [Geminicoccaceae bacterium]